MIMHGLANVKMTPCSLLGRYLCFGGTSSLHLQVRKVILRMEAAGFYEMFLSTKLHNYIHKDPMFKQ